MRPSATGMCSETPLSMDLTCAGMSSGPSVSCTQRGLSGGQAIERGHKIDLHIRIGIFLNNQRRRRVADEEKKRAVAGADALEKARRFARDVDKPLARGGDVQACGRNRLDGRLLNIRQIETHVFVSSCC